MNGARIEVSRIKDKSKMLVLISAIAAVFKLPAPEGSTQFSGGSEILTHSGARLQVREFTGVIDFLISEQTDDSLASRYFAGEDAARDAAYALFKTLNDRDVPVQTPEEVAAQAADGPQPQAQEPAVI